MTRCFLLLALFLLGFYSRGLAAELSLQECVDLALQHNSGLKAADEELAATRAGTAISRADFFPVLELEGGYSLLDQPERLIIEGDTFASGIPPQDVEVPVGDESFYQLDLSLTQPLFTGGRITHAHRRAKWAHTEARQQLARRKREIVRDVELAFHEGLNAQLYTGVVAKAAQAKQERLRVLRELAGEGYAAKEHVLQQETDLLFTELELTRGKNREQIARRRLAHLMGYEADPEQLRLSGKSYNAILTASLEDMLETAARHREELQAASSRVAILGEEVAIARSGYYPQLSLEGRYTRQKETNLTREDVWLVAAQFEWPLFEWGKTSAKVRRQAARKRQAQYQRRELENRVLLEAEQAWLSVKESEKAIVAHNQQLRTSEFRWNIMAERYAEGKMKLADLIEAEADLLKAYHEYLMAINDLDAGLARLEAAVSRSLKPWLLPGEIHTPELDFAAGRARARAAPEPVVLPPAEAPAAGDALESPEDEPVAVAANPPAPSYVVQAGSFRVRKNADERRAFLIRKLPGRRIVLTRSGALYRVRILGFESNDEAKETMSQAGITHYLVLRTSDGS